MSARIAFVRVLWCIADWRPHLERLARRDAQIVLTVFHAQLIESLVQRARHLQGEARTTNDPCEVRTSSPQGAHDVVPLTSPAGTLRRSMNW